MINYKLAITASTDNEAEEEAVSDLLKLERKAREGKADRNEHRLIFLLRTQLNLLPTHLWWSNEV